MKRSRLFLWIFGILMQAFLISMHFYQRNMEAMYAETEYLLKEVLNEELHRKQQELNLFYISKHCCPEKFYHSVSCLGPLPSGTLAVRSV